MIGNGPGAEVLGAMRVVPKAADGAVRLLARGEARLGATASTTRPRPGSPDGRGRAARRSALAAYQALGCRDLARIDFRVRDGVPYFLEANPLPGLAPVTSDLVILAEGMGLSHADLIRRILDAALARRRPGRAPSRGRAVTASRPRVAVLYNAPVLPADHPDAASEADVVEVAARSSPRPWTRTGSTPRRWPRRRRSRGLVGGSARRRARRGLQPDRGVRRLERRARPTSPACSNCSGLPYTGCPPEALALCHSKGRTKALLRGLGLPTAPFVVVGPGEPVPAWDWAVAGDRQARRRGRQPGDRPGERGRRSRRRWPRGSTRLRDALRRRGPGRGVPARPRVQRRRARPARARGRCRSPRSSYDRRPGAWPILTYAAKWDDGSAEDLASPVRCPAAIDPDLADRLGRAGRRGLPGDRLPRLRPGRLPARRAGRADDPGSEPEPRHRPVGRLGAGLAGVGSRLRGDDRGARPAGPRTRSAARPSVASGHVIRGPAVRAADRRSLAMRPHPTSGHGSMPTAIDPRPSPEGPMFRISHVLGAHREHDRRCLAEVQGCFDAAFPDLADDPDYIARKLADQTARGYPGDPPGRPRAGRPRRSGSPWPTTSSRSATPTSTSSSPRPSSAAAGSAGPCTRPSART